MICGSTTADIVARELNRRVELVDSNLGFASPPEYRMEESIWSVKERCF
jgi:hypothetical protein